MKDFETVTRARELTGGATPERYGDQDLVWVPRTGEVFTVTVQTAAPRAFFDTAGRALGYVP